MLAVKKSTRYFPQLTGVRAIAAYMVYIHHFNLFEKVTTGWIPDFFAEFHIGVSVFFVLSGFLISYRYIDDFSFSKKGFLTYLKKRVARIYPMYFLLTVVTLWFECYTGVFKENSNSQIALLFFANITFIRGFFDRLKFTLVGQGWSLTVEECFYFTAPLFFFYYRKYKKGLILFPAILLSLGFLTVAVFGRYNIEGFFKDNQFMLQYTFLGRCAEFFAGIYLALVIKRKESSPVAGVKNVYATLIGTLGMAACIACFVIIKHHTGYTYGALHPAGQVIQNFVLPLFVSLLFYGLIVEDTLAMKFLRSDLMVLLGKASYVFYLIHTGVIRQMVQIAVNKVVFFSINQSSFLYSALNYVLMFIILNILSILLFKYIEEKANKYINNLKF